MVGLREIALKQEYRSDRNDIVTEFFIPCLGNCIEYNRCVEFVSLNSLIGLVLGFDNFVRDRVKMRIITGHRFGAYDLDMISQLFESDKIFNVGNIRNSKIRMLKDIIDNGQLEIKIAIPNSEDVIGSFTEKMGIFVDENNDKVAFTGTSNEMFTNTSNKNFESIDVFTSWNDASRIDIKVDDFEKLWENKTNYLDVYSFVDAIRHNLAKYSTHWAFEDYLS